MLGMIPTTGLLVLALLSAAPTAPLHLAAAQAPAGGQAAECVSQDTVQLQKLKVLRLRFEFNEDKLSQEARDTLVEVAKWLKTQPKLQITVTGHADERGTEEFNIALGERRALAISNYLSSLGVPASQMRVVSYGEERPDSEMAKGGDDEKWSANRRVQFEPTGEVIDHDTTCKQGTEGTDPNANKAKEEPTAAKEEPKTDPNAGKQTSSTTSSRRFGWIPIWLGPLLMAAAVPGVLLMIPFIISIVYLGPTAIQAQNPGSCREPLSYPDNAFNSQVLNWCGSGWSVGLHSDQRPYAVPALAVGIVGALLSGVIALALFGVGAVFTGLYFVPGEGEDTTAVTTTTTSTTTDAPPAETPSNP